MYMLNLQQIMKKKNNNEMFNETYLEKFNSLLQ